MKDIYELARMCFNPDDYFNWPAYKTLKQFHAVAEEERLLLQRERQKTQALEKRLKELEKLLEVADSFVGSYVSGDLDGWEVALYQRRRKALLESNGEGVES